MMGNWAKANLCQLVVFCSVKILIYAKKNFFLHNIFCSKLSYVHFNHHLFLLWLGYTELWASCSRSIKALCIKYILCFSEYFWRRTFFVVFKAIIIYFTYFKKIIHQNYINTLDKGIHIFPYFTTDKSQAIHLIIIFHYPARIRIRFKVLLVFDFSTEI